MSNLHFHDEKKIIFNRAGLSVINNKIKPQTQEAILVSREKINDYQRVK